MDKSLLIFVAIGAGFLFFITRFVGDIQEDDKFQNLEYKEKHKFDHYQTVDSIGRQILDVSGSLPDEQVMAWNNVALKDEFVALFPDFSAMKGFAEERIRGEVLKVKLTNAINAVEGQYFSGTLNAEQAKKELSALK